MNYLDRIVKQFEIDQFSDESDEELKTLRVKIKMIDYLKSNGFNPDQYREEYDRSKYEVD